MPGSEVDRFAGGWLHPEAASAVIREVTRSFAVSGVPSSVALDTTWPDSEELEEDLLGVPWPAIDVGMIARHKDDLFLMSPEAFRYYLPAYIVRSLEDPVETDVAMSAVVGALCKPERTSSGPAWYGKDLAAAFRLFCEEEQRAVLSFLRFAASEGFVDDRRDPVGYWESLQA